MKMKMKILRKFISPEVRAVTDKVLEDVELQDKIYGNSQTSYYYDKWKKIRSLDGLNIIEELYVCDVDKEIKQAVRRRQLLSAVFDLGQPEPVKKTSGGIFLGGGIGLGSGGGGGGGNAYINHPLSQQHLNTVFEQYIKDKYGANP